MIAAVVSSSVGRCASSSISGRCAMLSIAACDIVDDRFSTSLKCSAHRSGMRLGSVSPVSAPALNIDEGPFACGPYIALRPSSKLFCLFFCPLPLAVALSDHHCSFMARSLACVDCLWCRYVSALATDSRSLIHCRCDSCIFLRMVAASASFSSNQSRCLRFVVPSTSSAPW